MKSNEEYQVCKQIAIYLRYQYPDIIYHFDLAGLNLSRAQAGMMKAIQGKRGWADLTIAEPKPLSPHHGGFGFCGLFLEVKKEGTKIFLKDGKTLVADEHIREQHEMLAALRKRGYYAEFGIGFEHCKQQISNYLKK